MHASHAMTNTVELLAPAGNPACLHAAVCAGADAVYLGLDEFNARRNADNFTLQNFVEACDYAHLRGVLVFVTMNVEILEAELARALDLARQAYLLGADAFIVQDVGLAAQMRRVLPEAPLHISTQMNIHNAAGIEAAARLGAARVTLARELSVAEIAELAELAGEYGMEVECFAHGALCICYSGQCLMSSMIGGRSANRGLCAQACRLAYELKREGREDALPSPGEHLLSPRDLCTIDMLDALIDAKVASLKIEGRMKSADYVYEVVRVYREVLGPRLTGLGAGAGGSAGAGIGAEGDASAGAGSAGNAKPPAVSRRATDAQKARLSEAFSRGFTTAYLQGQRGNEIMSYGRPNNRGVFAGRVTRVGDGVAFIRPEQDLNAHDIVEFWTNKGHFAAEVPVSAASGDEVAIPVEKRTGKGDRVFRVRNALAAFNAQQNEPRIPITGEVTLRLGQPAHLTFSAHDGSTVEVWGDVAEAARTRALAEDDVRAHVDRLGQTPFVLEELSVLLDDGVGMGFSQLHHLRADALERLAEVMLEPYRKRRKPAEEAAHDAAKDAWEKPRIASGAGRAVPAKRRSATVCAWTTNPGCARAAKRAGADALYVPLLNFRRNQALLAGKRQPDAEQAGYPKQCIMAIPTIDHDPLPGTREYLTSYDLWDYVREGKPVFADSLAAVTRASSIGAVVEAGLHIPVTNTATLQYLADLGVKRVWLSPELTLAQIADLAKDSPVELGIFVTGSQELMITEHCLLMSQGPCAEQCQQCARREEAHYLVDRKGFQFPVVTDMLGRSHLYNGVELDATGSLLDLIDMGLSAFMVDTTLLDKKSAEAAVNRVLKARDAGLERRSTPKRPGTTTGHLFRGVQ